MKKTTLFFAGILFMLLAIQTAFSQTEFQLDSVQKFDWDLNFAAFEMNEREHFTYDNGGTKDTLFEDFIVGNNGIDWYPYNRLEKTYNEFNNIILEVGSTYDPVFDVWYGGDPSDGLYYEYDASQNNTAIGWGWHGSDPDFLFTYNSDNLVTIKTERYYNFIEMGMSNLYQTLTNYNGLQKADEILQTWHTSTSTWSDEEKTEYTYSGDLPIQEDTYYWASSDWATQAFKRHLNSYTNAILTEKIVQSWDNGSNSWENTERTTWTLDTNENIQEILTFIWDENTSTWLNDEQELWYWSEAGELLDLVEEPILQDNSVRIYPNPASGYFTIVGLNLHGSTVITNENVALVKVFTLSGATVIEATISSDIFPNGIHSIDIENLPSGIYIVGVNTANFNITRKLIVNN